MEPEWVIINHDYEGSFKQELKIEKIEKDIEVVDLTPVTKIKEVEPEKEFDPKEWSTTKFRNNIDNFTIEEIEIFTKDSRKTISNEAKKHLKKIIE
jgi:hypothetical protein